MLRRASALLASLLPVVLVASCGVRPAGYGVVLWGETAGALSTGSIVPVVREAPINSSYLLAVPGENKPREFLMGRIRFFHTRRDAEDFSRAYAPHLQEWAVSMKQDPPPLPIRDLGSQEGRVIYKLKPGQVMKVVGRSAARETVQQFADFWYEVVTEDGYSGFCFGHYLKTFSTSGDPSQEARRILSQDEALDRIMGNPWRPDWFREMVARGTIDLAIFREDVGLFPSPSDNIFHLALPQYSLDFPYTGVQKLGQSTYVFTGSDLRITVLDEERISIYYHYKDQRVAGLYTLMKQEVADLVTAEQKRRQAIFDSIVSRGASFSSTAYGAISLSADMRFTWTGYQKLVPSVIPADAVGKGRVDFPLHVGKELAGDYDGAITFVFDRAGDPGASAASASGAALYSVSFLYKATAGGLRFTSLDRDSVTNLFVTYPGISPVVIFLTQSSH